MTEDRALMVVEQAAPPKPAEPAADRPRHGWPVRVALLSGLVLSTLLATALHARQRVDTARDKLMIAGEQAEIVASALATADALQRRIDTINDAATRFETLTGPVGVSETLTLVVDALPPAAELDGIELAVHRDGATGARMTLRLSGHVDDAAAMTGVSSVIESNALFRNVIIDVLESRHVRGRDVHDFLARLEVDLDAARIAAAVPAEDRP